MSVLCSKCGNPFAPPRASWRGGRPRTRCDACRSNHAKIDGKRWRTLRQQILAGNPPCAVPSCGRLATQVDHIVALSQGGAPYDLGNLRPICGPCNASKASRVRNDLPGLEEGVPAPRSYPYVVEHGNAKTTYYADGTQHTESNLRWSL
ncbi:HNH endonuclease signature motif containing protein [Phycicoccus sp. 3266]|uniref:HNH endonuclease signature motif containing protein n=1 Tax=Phycicoccus sp. 3266 TaxID=2817751 RepID=UPI00285F7854|nr:HNH endonuclease signature motif containing protein [Phycicoccus sp. 3266]MDR6862161.1 5-methylcytosine-specific restriction endonuclease McrA [Phycicoccus sp. 3266]